MNRQFSEAFGKAINAILDISAEDLPLESPEIIGDMYIDDAEQSMCDFPRFEIGNTVFLFDCNAQPIGHGTVENWSWDHWDQCHQYDVKLDIGHFIQNVPESLLEPVQIKFGMRVIRGGRS